MLTTAPPSPYRVASAVARHGVDVRGAVIEVPVADDAWDEVVDVLRRERLAGLAVAAVGDGTLDVAAPRFERLCDLHESQMAIDVSVERLAVDATEELSLAGVDYRVLKGPALARLVYPDPALRSFGDLDLLVPSAELDHAVRCLGRLGFARRTAEPRRGFDQRFTKAVCLIGPDGTEIDVHRTLAPGPFGTTIDNRALFAAPPATFELGGRVLQALPRDLALLHAATHAVVGDVAPRLVTLRDVVQIVGCHDGDELAGAVEWAGRFGCEVLLAHALAQVETVLGVPLAGEAVDEARSYVETRRDHWRLRAYRSVRGRYPAQSAATFWSLPHTRDRVAYARALAFPARGYVAAHGGSYRSRLALGARLVAHWRPR